MSTFDITNNEREQQFEVIVEGEKALIQYRFKDGALVLMHTAVPDKLGGRGIATALAEYAFSYARAHHFPVIVYCPFVAAWLKRHPEQMDIVVKPQ